MSGFAHPGTLGEHDGVEGGDHGSAKRYTTLGGRVYADGVMLDASPSAHVLAVALITANGRVVGCHDIVRTLGSRSGNPANLVKVLVHELRSCTGGDIPIRTHRGAGLSWTTVPDRTQSIRTHRVTFDGSKMLVDGTRIALRPLSERIARYLWLRPGRTHAASDITRAIGSDSRDPANVIKVSMHAIRRAFREIGLSSPVQSVRGSGARWSEVDSLAEHDVTEADADRTGDQQPPR